jgi:hypothetical protein
VKLLALQLEVAAAPLPRFDRCPDEQGDGHHDGDFRQRYQRVPALKLHQLPQSLQDACPDSTPVDKRSERIGTGIHFRRQMAGLRVP